MSGCNVAVVILNLFNLYVVSSLLLQKTLEDERSDISSYQQRSLPDSFHRVMLTNSRPAYMTIGTSQDYRIDQQRECTTLTEKKVNLTEK